jgi:hypothetical protein
VPTIAGQVRLRPLGELRGDPAGIAADAAQHLVRHADGWWLHIDLDVLAGSEFPACDAATDPATPGGLTWAELVTVTTAALRTGGCRGCSIGVYNTDLDPGGHAATSWQHADPITVPSGNHRRSAAAPTAYRPNAARTAAAVELKYPGGSMKPHSLNTRPLVRARR